MEATTGMNVKLREIVFGTTVLVVFVGIIYLLVNLNFLYHEKINFKPRKKLK